MIHCQILRLWRNAAKHLLVPAGPLEPCKSEPCFPKGPKQSSGFLASSARLIPCFIPNQMKSVPPVSWGEGGGFTVRPEGHTPLRCACAICSDIQVFHPAASSEAKPLGSTNPPHMRRMTLEYQKGSALLTHSTNYNSRDRF